MLRLDVECEICGDRHRFCRVSIQVAGCDPDVAVAKRPRNVADRHPFRFEQAGERASHVVGCELGVAGGGRYTFRHPIEAAVTECVIPVDTGAVSLHVIFPHGRPYDVAAFWHMSPPVGEPFPKLWWDGDRRNFAAFAGKGDRGEVGRKV